MDAFVRFEELLVRSSAELYADNSEMMGSPDLIRTPNVIDTGDVELFFLGVEAGLISVMRGGRFNTCDRPKAGGRWSLLSRSREGGWYNAEYLPQLAAYVDCILNLGYPRERVFFELPARSLQLDLAIVDDDQRVIVLGEAKRDVAMLDKLRASMLDRFALEEPGPETKKRGDEARQLAWRLWTTGAPYCWLIGPGHRPAFRVGLAPLTLNAVSGLPAASQLGLDHVPPQPLAPPDLTR